jgi:hypothetical protein
MASMLSVMFLALTLGNFQGVLGLPRVYSSASTLHFYHWVFFNWSHSFIFLLQYTFEKCVFRIWRELFPSEGSLLLLYSILHVNEMKTESIVFSDSLCLGVAWSILKKEIFENG